MKHFQSWAFAGSLACLYVLTSASALHAQPAPAAQDQGTVPGASVGETASPTNLPPAPSGLDAARARLVPAAGGLTADSVAERTVANSYTVRARLAELDAARARLDQTTAQFFPRLTLRAAYTRLSPVSSGFGSGALVGAQNGGLLGVGPCPTGAGQCVLDSQGQPVGAAAFAIESLEDTYSLTASLSVPISDYILRLSDAAAGASASRHAAEIQVAAEKLKVRTDARALFYDWVRATGRVAVAEKSLERTQARLKDAHPAFELGVITRADLMRLEALLASTEQVVLETRGFRDLAQRQLTIFMGKNSPEHFTIGEDVDAPVEPVRGDLEGFTREALASRLELRAMEETLRSMNHAASALSVGAWPRLDAFGDVAYANPNQRFFPQQREWQATWSVGIAATWTLGDAFISSASARELSATAASVDAQRAALADGIRQEVAMYYIANVRSAGALESARRGTAAAEEAYRVATDLYRVGKATTTDVIEAESDLLSARLREIDAKIELRSTRARLLHATGRDITAQ